jgi:hypothetical protein
MDKPYNLEAWVHPGVMVDDFSAATLDEVIERADDVKAKWPKAAIVYCNNDLTDIDDDGLTEEERERLPWY